MLDVSTAVVSVEDNTCWTVELLKISSRKSLQLRVEDNLLLDSGASGEHKHVHPGGSAPCEGLRSMSGAPWPARVFVASAISSLKTLRIAVLGSGLAQERYFFVPYLAFPPLPQE